MRRVSIGKGAALAMLGVFASLPAIAQAPKPAAKPTGAAATSNLPYDISADQQEVFNEQHRSIYRGNVVVIQGADRLNTPQLTLIFTPKAAPAGGKPAPSAASATSTFGKIQQMDAEGPVYFTTPTQNAKGDHGVYLASNDTITLTGNVVLVQNKDVSTGDKLVIDRTTDHYTLYKKSGQDRVRGVFYQDEPANGQTPGAAKATTKTGPAHP